MAAPLVLDPLPIQTPRVLFDVSRLLRRRAARHGTGVDRIDLAIGLELSQRFGPACRFLHAAPTGPLLLQGSAGRALLEGVAARWRGETPRRRTLLSLMWGARRASPEALADTTYVVASHSGLPLRSGALRRIDPGRALRRLVYVHDLIPIEFPEYQRARSVEGFRRFLAEVADGPVSFAANSTDTAERLARHAAREGWAAEAITVRTPRLGPATPPRPPRAAVAATLADPAPFFLCVGTIEPRKNHLLLLTLWRALAAEGIAPRLVLVGRRGWENEMVVDMLERCPAMRAHVAEFGDLDDHEVRALMARARALLMPSFAEGLGIPVLEAAAAGLPAIVSDLPALREIAPPGTLFLDPLDGPAWRRAILAALP